MKKSKAPIEVWFESESKKIKISSNVKDHVELSPDAKMKVEKAKKRLAKITLPK